MSEGIKHRERVASSKQSRKQAVLLVLALAASSIRYKQIQ